MHHCNYINTQLLCIMVYSTVTLVISIYMTPIIYFLIRFYIEYIFSGELEGESWTAVTLPWFPGVHPVGDSKDL